MATKREMVEAIDEALERRSRRRRRVHDFNEAMQLYLGCVGGFAFLSVFLPGLLTGTLPWFFIGGALLAGVCALIQNQRLGITLSRTLIVLVLAGGLASGLVYGTHWYFMVYLMAQPNPLGTFGGPG